ncbi:Endonuclease/Exonuclease/phosphatase family protein [Flavobacterium caeni]|uniref:Endonuclease/Exonuclease/phosphatase family protein n=2 Tax=Flavobacterium caeni TaxID=490189 RepID=A0A1G5B1R9_9FLAO|nr:Endonuclease/Exonuclease/phosphatase family protein [Flavobacterium caeni]
MWGLKMNGINHLNLSTMSFLQIASWNIEHLSGQARAQRRQSAYALTDHIEMAGIDLIALQEVYLTPTDEEVRMAPHQPIIPSHAHTERRNSDLDIVCYLLEEHLDVPWKYLILPNRSDGDRSQLCAVLWNTDRLTLGDVQALDVKHKEGDLSLWDRKPHVVNFFSKIDVWRKDADGKWQIVWEKRELCVVPLHMKSNYGGVTKNRQVRGLEAETLCVELAKLRPQIDPSLVLLGDTNILKNDEPAIETFVDHGFIDLNNNDTSTYWSKDYSGAPFDRFFVAKDRPEFKYSRQYVLRSADLEMHDRFLSDHYMIKMSVKDYLDDAVPRP